MSETQVRQGLFERPMPPGYRDELAVLLAAPLPVASQQAGSVLLFRLGGLRLALPTRVASAVSPILPIARVPHRSGTVLLGLVAFRGDILPCCSLARLLDVEQEHSEASRILILEESPGRAWAVSIDAVLGVVSAGATSTDTSTEIVGPHAGLALPIATHWLLGSFHDGDGAFHLLDQEIVFRQITLATA
jgi:chemotaxis signal transduction protein